MRVSNFEAARRVAYKELLDGVRHRAGYVTMGMFALTVIAFLSMSLAGGMSDARLTAALLWVVVFFAATLQGERLFAEEAAAGTLLFLRIYVPAQAVLFGKMAAHFVTLLILAAIVLPLILILMNAPFVLDVVFLTALVLGLWGMAAADTLLAAVAAGASVRGGLVPVLLLPSMLPILLPAIALTAGEGEPSLLGGMLIYDMALTVGASMLFDSLWIES
ncbi:heme exporter protein CcmB [Selenomonas sp. oral taxon 892]|uniref:heme exporter protein CcmB n=1 Tax=Selenomonas sp. oral taxon 892 TaxID=1321785 RepID=UPI0003AD5E3B|nr:heme exporter protein CcmB [Selenomonas sp. oral taxon 892]ERJ96057.1 putative heme exporter protein CcmB [Selenomonas sp. oral taxon 892 str. F0426]